MADTNNDNAPPTNNWTFDVQRGLAWTIVLLFGFIVAVMASRVAISAEINDINDVLKSALAVLFNIVMLILGFFFGSSKSSQIKDEQQAKTAEKLAEKVIGPMSNDPTPVTTVTTVPTDATTTPTTTTVTTADPKEIK